MLKSDHRELRNSYEKLLWVGGWMVVVGVWVKTRTAPAQKQIRSAELVNYPWNRCIYKFKKSNQLPNSESMYLQNIRTGSRQRYLL